MSSQISCQRPTLKTEIFILSELSPTEYTNCNILCVNISENNWPPRRDERPRQLKLFSPLGFSIHVTIKNIHPWIELVLIA